MIQSITSSADDLQVMATRAQARGAVLAACPIVSPSILPSVTTINYIDYISNPCPSTNHLTSLDFDHHSPLSILSETSIDPWYPLVQSVSNLLLWCLKGYLLMMLLPGAGCGQCRAMNLRPCPTGQYHTGVHTYLRLGRNSLIINHYSSELYHSIHHTNLFANKVKKNLETSGPNGRHLTRFPSADLCDSEDSSYWETSQSRGMGARENSG